MPSPHGASPTHVIPIPTSRYRDPLQDLPEWIPSFSAYRMCTTSVPANAPAELTTVFISFAKVLKAIRAQYPGWPQPFATPSPAVYHVLPVKGMDLGMIAATDIAAGELIVRERPFVLHPLAMELDYSEVGTIVKEVMLAENERAVRSLHNCFGNGRLPELLEIMLSNQAKAGPFPGHKVAYGGLPRDISRANHSCQPNAHLAFDAASLSFSLRAVRYIPTEDEITVSYLTESDIFIPSGMRKILLEHRRGFSCACKCCRLAGDARDMSDSRRLFIRTCEERNSEYDADFEIWLEEGASTEQDPPIRMPDGPLLVDNLQLASFIWDAMVEEECYASSLWEPVLARLVKGYAVLENEERVRYYATKAAELGKAYTGSDGGWRAVAEHPRETDWWDRLGAKRKV